MRTDRIETPSACRFCSGRQILAFWSMYFRTAATRSQSHTWRGCGGSYLSVRQAGVVLTRYLHPCVYRKLKHGHCRDEVRPGWRVNWSHRLLNWARNRCIFIQWPMRS